MKRLSLAIGIAVLVAGCGGESNNVSGSGVTVRVEPAEVQLRPGDTQQFTARVTGTDETTVIWTADGTGAGASISPNGLYTAPGTEGTYHVFVASAADRTAYAHATITVDAEVVPEVEIGVHPAEASMKPGMQLQLSATVTGADDTSVTWSVEEGAAGGEVDAAGLYTSPATAGTYHVVATSVADTTKSAAATITVDPDVTPTIVVTVMPTTATLQVEGQQKFNATVSGTDEKAVTWSVEEAAGGTVDDTGLYSAPDVAGTYHVVATSVADATRSAAATVTVKPKPVETDIDMTILPADRRTVWNPGIPGGIPTKRTVFTTLDSIPTNGTGDAAAAINQAIVDAGAAYAASKTIQEVVLPAGTIRTTRSIRLGRTGVVLRGQGMGQTRIRYDGGGSAFRFGAENYTDFTSETGPFNLQEDGVKGTNQIVVSNADAARIQAGDVLCIDEEDDPAFVRIGDAEYEKRQPGGDGHGPALRNGNWRSVTSMVQVTAKTAGATNTTLTLAEPLHMSFRKARFAQVFHIATARQPYDGVHYIGIEDLYFTGGTLDTNAVAFCWMKNVEVDGFPGTKNIGSYTNQPGISGRSVDLFHAYRCEIRGSYIHHSRSISQGGGAYLLSISSYSSENLIEDNIVVWGNKLVVGNMMGGGNVIAYNYVDNARTSHASWQEGAIDLNHQSFTHNALVEGNWSMNIVSDTTHGNAGWHVFFRNHATGRNSAPLWGNYPYNSGDPDRDFMRAAGADGFHRETTFVGNVLHTDDNGVYEINQDTGNSDPAAIFRIGWAWFGDGSNTDDGTALRLMYRHGNWDSVTDSLRWDDANPVKTLPPSLYLKAKPAFFGDGEWPWVDPTGATPGARLKVLPAKARFDAMQ